MSRNYGMRAAGLYMQPVRPVVAPAPIIEDFAIREHGDGIRSIPEPMKRKDARTDREFRVSLPFVAFQHGDAR